ncbi:MAG: caspase family protein [Phaeodactylibacter sp.]|nr:caspase family protein [Phaeodactylibacter sp.]MCB9272821.1 caspase family protein [Lewinellaceae bacterium]
MSKTNVKEKGLPALYAVLAGINDYPYLPAEKQLSGCVNDVRLMEGLLQEPFLQARFSAIHLLPPILNQQADKAAITAAIRGHLGKAKPGDFALFYYSGHGIREATSLESFQEEELDSNIAGIICTDFRQPGKKDPGDTVLSDKEFRYLIRELAVDKQAQVAMLFDCCHSGSNTRSALSDAIPARARQVERRALPAREWEGFIFHDAPGLKEKVQNNAPLEEVLPQGPHIMMAACLEVELAWEAESGHGGQSNGAFTRALVDVVKEHNGEVTYHNLHTRILNRLRFHYQNGSFRDQRQTPQFYINSPEPNGRYKLFLSNQRASQRGDATLDYNQSDREWRLSLGALHGLPPNSREAGLKAAVFPLHNRSKRKEARILKVYPMHSVVEFPAGLDKAEGPFLGAVDGLAIPKLQVFLAGEEQGVALAKDELGKLLESASRQLFELTPKEDSADYVLNAKGGKYGYFLPFEPARPLIRATPYLGANGKPDASRVEDVFNALNQMSEWSFLKNLNHFSGKVPPALQGTSTMYPIELRLYEYTGEGKERRIKPMGNQFTFELSPDKPYTWIRFELENYSTDLLHTSLVYMPYNFGFLSDERACFLRAPQLILQKNEKACSRKFGKRQPEDNDNGKEYLMLKVDPYTSDYNLPAEHNYIKFLSSKTPFEIKALHMEPLPLPDDEAGKKRGFDFDEEEEEPRPFEWEVRTFELVVSNPGYQPG